MTYTETHTVTLTKLTKRNLQDKVMRANANAIIAATLNKSLKVRGWGLTDDGSEQAYRSEPADVAGYKYVFSIDFKLTFTREDGKRPERNELASLCRTIASRANQPTTGYWTVGSVDGDEYNPPEDGEYATTADMIEYAPVELPDAKDWEEYFEHLYGLDYQITRVRRAAEAAVQSNWDNRYHVALVGPPGCGKSDIARSFKRMIGDEAVLEFDATNMTQAGAIKELSEREILPRVIVIEEIEKADPNALKFLLALLDTRGEIRKVTARANIQRDTKCLCIATVNNYELFCGLQSNALESRFSNPVFFKRPDRDTLEAILRREITKIGGDYAWIDPALDYCEEIKEYDPRKIIAICLCGREMLLDGSYQEMMRATSQETVNFLPAPQL